jgi:nicotinamidase/pyrazinamidase
MTPTAQDVLIVVDVQNDFVSGTMAIPDAKRIIPPINALADAMPNIVVATDWHPQGHVSFASNHPGTIHGDEVAVFYGMQRVYHDHCVQNEWGAELDPDLRLGKAQLILRKGYRLEVESNGCFYENDGVTRTGLTEYLRARAISRVFCTGLARYGCVMQSALGAARDGFEVFMVDDASAGRPRADEADILQQIAGAGISWVTSADLLTA